MLDVHAMQKKNGVRIYSSPYDRSSALITKRPVIPLRSSRRRPLDPNIEQGLCHAFMMANKLFYEPDDPANPLNNFLHHANTIHDIARQFTKDFWPFAVKTPKLTISPGKTLDRLTVNVSNWADDPIGCEPLFSIDLGASRMGLSVVRVRPGKKSLPVTLKSTPAALEARCRDDERRKSQQSGGLCAQMSATLRHCAPCLPPPTLYHTYTDVLNLEVRAAVAVDQLNPNDLLLTDNKMVKKSDKKMMALDQPLLK